ncbi:MAG: hypothetical protein J07HQW1_01971 [Haloquadratum walsbyi J07HQW1]|jgi:hypothetical protein|uniref:Uncharacterized protein n=1 Tax=Haloquadratum walsbyi J07HQW1 TaxID=1238424 RepID=U1PE94_9EURY|nr:MAG: hypothetical protein J07HQW1_01971 [Haloquadratum walsbyi J07HQW1]
MIKRRSVLYKIRAEQYKQSSSSPDSDRQQSIQSTNLHEHLADSNEQCQHSTKLCLSQTLQTRNENRETRGLSVSTQTDTNVNTQISVLAKLTEATWLVLRRRCGDTQSYVMLSLPSPSCSSFDNQTHSSMFLPPFGSHQLRCGHFYDTLIDRTCGGLIVYLNTPQCSVIYRVINTEKRNACLILEIPPRFIRE